MEQAISIDRLMDLSLDENLVPNANFHGEWYDQMEWQFNALKTLGLKPEHKLLDVGSGPMRLGMAAVPYLDSGNYYGIDAFEPYIRLGDAILTEMGTEGKEYHLHVSDVFDFSHFNAQFDFAMCQSVFTHLSLEQIHLCVSELKKVMKPGSTMIFTYIRGRKIPRGFLYYGTFPMTYPAFCEDAFFEKLAKEYGITFELSSIKHGTQTVATFTF